MIGVDMSQSLVSQTEELREIFGLIDHLEETGEEVPASLITRLESSLTSQAEKIDSCAAFVSRAKSDLDWLDGEIELLQKRKKQIERGVDRMKELAKFVMEREQIRELVGLKGHKFSLRDSFSCSVVDEKVVPGAYTRITQKVEVNKLDALKDLKLGREIPGLLLSKNTSVVVK